ncbi:hypothetical protein [Amycolatopsis sp. RTGN1]|uniref:hypothetical protein n=1 Tax=Amycolatopsis ponsaeliensis TaxID=2992142 RepID=UPI00254D2FFF|nr:hypothetical protein [Amycolatopsis sp. RTGN1]
MTTDGERAALAQELSRLSLVELVDVLRRVLPGHDERDVVMPSTLCLAEVSPVPARDDLPPVVEIVAWPDRDYYDGGFGGEPANREQGSCLACGLEVTSSAKRAFCPVCGTDCRLT